MSAYKVHTYADGFGCWHAEVSIGGNAIGSIRDAEDLAYDAIRAEIKQRNHADILKGIVHETTSSRDGTLTYYFKEA